VLAAVITMILLGRWQMSVSERKGFSLQNFGYALQWWAFTIFALVLWLKILRDRARSTGVVPGSAGVRAAQAAEAAEAAAVAAEPVAYRRYVMPQSSDGPVADVDPEQAAYNAYLASLADKDSP
jgi:DNA-binding transcriptional regulator of glucitol operon